MRLRSNGHPTVSFLSFQIKSGDRFESRAGGAGKGKERGEKKEEKGEGQSRRGVHFTMAGNCRRSIITTLVRGASDLLTRGGRIAAALKADAFEIYTDVDGRLPRRKKKKKGIKKEGEDPTNEMLRDGGLVAKFRRPLVELARPLQCAKKKKGKKDRGGKREGYPWEDVLVSELRSNIKTRHDHERKEKEKGRGGGGKICRTLESLCT